MWSFSVAVPEAFSAASEISLHERTVAGRERALGADRPDTLTARDDLAGGAHR